MISKKVKLSIAIAALTGIGLGVSQTASADAYGYAASDVTNFLIQTTGSVVLQPGSVSGNNAATDGVFETCTGAFGTTVDCLQSAGGTASGGAVAENTFLPQGTASSISPGPISADFARADGIADRNIPNGDFSVVVAEAQSTGSFQVGASNYALSADFQFTVAENTLNDTLQFTFDADQIIEASLDALVEPDPLSLAQSSINFLITITPDGSSVPLFIYAPDGTTGILGGTINQEDFALANTQIANQGGEVVGVANSGSFDVITNDFGPGTYDVSVQFGADVAVKRTPKSVPEPLTAGLFGAGLIALAGIRRRNRKLKA